MKMIKRTSLFAFLALMLSAPGNAQNEIVSTEKAPAAIGPYSQAVLAGDTLYVSGQLPIDLATNEILQGDISAQTNLSLTHIKNILEESGFSLTDVVKSEIFLKDLNDFKAMNTVYAEYFAKNSPARFTVQAARIPQDALVEIAVIAVRNR